MTEQSSGGDTNQNTTQQKVPYRPPVPPRTPPPPPPKQISSNNLSISYALKFEKPAKLHTTTRKPRSKNRLRTQTAPSPSISNDSRPINTTNDSTPSPPNKPKPPVPPPRKHHIKPQEQSFTENISANNSPIHEQPTELSPVLEQMNVERSLRTSGANDCDTLVLSAVDDNFPTKKVPPEVPVRPPRFTQNEEQKSRNRKSLPPNISLRPNRGNRARVGPIHAVAYHSPPLRMVHEEEKNRESIVSPIYRSTDAKVPPPPPPRGERSLNQSTSACTKPQIPLLHIDLSLCDKEQSKPLDAESSSSLSDDISSENEDGTKKKKEQTYWKTLENQIMQSPVEETLLSARNSRKERKPLWIHSQGATHSLESQRMRSFTTEESHPKASLEAVLHEYAEAHRHDVTARGERREKLPEVSTQEAQSDVTTRPATGSTSTRPKSVPASFAVHTKKVQKTESHLEIVQDAGKQDNNIKKFFGRFIKNKTVDIAGPVTETDFSWIGDLFLSEIRNAKQMTLEDFLHELKTQSTLPNTLKNNNIDTLYYNEFEADDASTVEVSTDDPSNITFATIFKLIQRLSLPESLDALLRSVFLLTYRAFLSPKELLELFICRAFSVPPPTDTKASEDWPKKQLAIQSRITIVIGTWIAEYFRDDFKQDNECLYLLAHFTHFLSQNPKTKNYTSILLFGVGQHLAPTQQELSNAGKKFKYPKPHVPKTTGTLKLVNCNPTEVARQLALVEKEIFNQISPSEYMHQGWTRADKLKRSPNIVAMIERFNDICNWVSSEVLKESKLKERTVILQRLIIIAEESRALCNFNAVMAIISGLQCSAIYRLQDTWDMLPPKTWDIWDDLNDLMSNEQNFATYRAVLSEVTNLNIPCVPYIGVFLTDLVFVEDGNSDYLPGTNLINVTKLRFSSGILFRLEKCKPLQYRFTAVPVLQKFIATSASTSLNEEQQRELSLKIQSL